MKNLKRFSLLAFVALLGIFTFRNQSYLGQRVDLVFLSQPVSLVLGFWLVLCFLLGLFVYMVVDLPRDMARKRELRRRAQEMAKLQAEVNCLQALAPGASRPVPSHDLEKRLGL